MKIGKDGMRYLLLTTESAYYSRTPPPASDSAYRKQSENTATVQNVLWLKFSQTLMNACMCACYIASVVSDCSTPGSCVLGIL